MSVGRQIKVTIGGPKLLMHNGRLADPLDPATRVLKEVQHKKTKSDDDHSEIARLEFLGGLYIDDEIGPYIPGEAVLRMLEQGARQKKRGAKVAPVSIVEDQVALQYDGPRDETSLWENPKFRDRRAVVVGRSRVIRTRPKFTDWKLSFTIDIPEGVPVNPSDIEEALIDAGMFVGLGDFRPGSPKRGKFGMFNVLEFAEVKAKRAA